MSDLNFYLDNDDLRFHIEKMVNWKPIVELKERLGSEECPYESVDEAVETYVEMLADPIGEIAANRLALRAEEIDRQGCSFEGGTVILPEGMRKNLQDLSDAQLMGITLPRSYGGLNFPTTFYTAATEMVSRADVSLMNFFGLQGIAETIALFASDELKEQYLLALASGEQTGAMVLTESDAGSDLGAIQTKAILDADTGQWTIRGTKRFITNGCGEVLLVLARSEDPDKFGGGRGLSLFLVEKGKGVVVRRIENKMGIHGSPTCELYFDNAPGFLIGQRGRGLTRYVNWLMEAARLAIATQSLGICEAAFREAQKYAEEREQFGKQIRYFPAVADMLVNMKITTEAVRSLVYETSQMVDLAEASAARLATIEQTDPQYEEMKKQEDHYRRLAGVLTPLAKYYATEACITVTYQALQIHGGNGFMKDYPIERLYRDARITSIYEGTSEIQVNWAISRIMRGHLNAAFDSFAQGVYTNEALASEVRKARQMLQSAVEYVTAKKRSDGQKDTEYADLMARKIVDMAIDIYVSYLFLKQSGKSERKKLVAKKFIGDMTQRVAMNLGMVTSGDRTAVDHLSEIVY